jgi:hypothetical protein
VPSLYFYVPVQTAAGDLPHIKDLFVRPEKSVEYVFNAQQNQIKALPDQSPSGTDPNI